MTTPTRWPYKLTVPKDPDATLDYSIDWSDWLADGESIAASDWIVDGVTEVASSFDATTATVWLSGGVVGEVASITNHITTDNAIPRIDDRTLLLKIAER